MANRIWQVRFSLRTLVVLVTALCVALWFASDFSHLRRGFHVRSARQRFDKVELATAGGGNPKAAPSGLVAILGDSRFKHWNRVKSLQDVGKGLLISSSLDATTCLWDTNTGRQSVLLPAPLAATSNDGSRVFLLQPDGSIAIYDVAARAVSGTLDGQQSRLTGMLADTTGARLLTWTFTDNSFLDVTLWDVANSTNLNRFRIPRESPADVGFSELMIVALSRDGSLVATSRTIIIDIWNTATGQLVKSLGPFLSPEGDRAAAYHAAFDAKAESVFIGDVAGILRQVNLESGEVTQTWAFPSGVRGLAINAQGDPLCRLEDSVVNLRPRWSGSGNLPVWSSFSMNGRKPDAVTPNVSAVALEDHEIVLVSNGVRKRLQGGGGIDVQCLAFDPQGKWVVTGGRNGELALWRMDTWELTKLWTAHSARVEQVAFNPKRPMVASMSEDHTVVLSEIPSGKEIQVCKITRGWGGIAFSPDGKTLATEGALLPPAQPSQMIQFWDVNTGKKGQVLNGRMLSGECAFSADGKRIAGNEYSGAIQIFDVETSKLVATVGTKIAAGRMPVAVSRDGSWVVGTKVGRDVAVWDVSSGTELSTWRPHLGGRIESIAISPYELMIATTSDDGCVKLWERSNGSLLATLPIGPAKGRILEVAFSPDGFYLATVNGNGTAYLVEAPRGLLMPANATAPASP